MPSRWTPRRERFRAALAGDRCLFPGSVYDPLSARIAEDLGFEIGMFAGSVASLAVLGAPDLIVLTLSEFADQALRINRAGELPLLVDADHGYGNALNVMRTVEELENAGVAGLSIEDTDLPQPFGAAEPRLLPLEAGVGKLRAAVAARRDPALVIAGRTSVGPASGFDEVLARVQAYRATGVDAIFVVGVKTAEQIVALGAAAELPLILGGVPASLQDRETLAGCGVRVCLQGHQPFMAAVQAAHATLKALREGCAPADLQGVAPAQLIRTLSRADRYRGWSEEFLTANDANGTDGTGKTDGTAGRTDHGGGDGARR